jgi:hypothetical protein
MTHRRIFGNQAETEGKTKKSTPLSRFCGQRAARQRGNSVGTVLQKAADAGTGATRPSVSKKLMTAHPALFGLS